MTDSALAKAMRVANPLHPVHGEITRGLITSVVVGMILAYAEALAKRAGVADDALVLYLDMILGALIGFSMDIVFGTAKGFCSLAKGAVHRSCIDSGVQQLGNPVQYMLGEIGGISFLKFAITVLIDAMVTLPLFSMAIKSGIDTPSAKKMIKLFIATVTFFLYANKTRFHFAYKQANDNMDLTMTVFLTAISMAFLAFPEDENLSTVFSTKSRFFMVSLAFILMCVYFAIKGVRSGSIYNLFHGSPRRSALTGTAVIVFLMSLVLTGMSRASDPKYREVDMSYEMSSLAMAVSAVLFLVGFVYRIRK
jgi:hypothetical protein